MLTSVIVVEYWIVSNETNTDVYMYTFSIYSYIVESVVHANGCYTSGYTLENENDGMNLHNLHCFIYKHLNRHENT